MLKNTICLVDAHAFLHRSFHALPRLTTESGEETGALYGFVKMLVNLLQKKQPEFIAVCFDSKGGSAYRNALYPEYKANRPPVDEALKPQLEKARDATEALGLVPVFLEGWEADDIMATLARSAKAEGIESLIISGDKDVCQLIQPGISAWDGISQDIRDSEYVEKRYGVPPAAFADYLALLGDSSDNVPGVAGIGAKSAATLLRKYGSLDKALAATADPDILANDKILQKLSKDAENARLSRKLVSLEQDVPFESIDFESYRPKGFDTLAFRDFSGHYKFKILNDIKSYSPPEIKEEKLLVEKPFPFLLDIINSSSSVSISAENGALCIAVDKYAGMSGNLSNAEKEKILSVLGNPGIFKNVFALKSVLSMLSASENFRPENFFDCEAAEKMLHFHAKGKTLQELACETFGYVPKILQTEQDIQGISALADLCEKFRKEAEDTGQKNLLENIEFPLLSEVYAMEKRGIYVDRDKLKSLSEKYAGRMSELQKKANELAGGEINLNSPKQLAFVLYEKFNPDLSPAWRRQFKNKDGYSTSEEALLPLKDEIPLIPVILEYREISKLKSTFADPIYEASAADGRVHTMFDQLGTNTGRFSSSSPNLQNIPVRSENGQAIRECFIAPEGYTLLSADYSQIDLRVLAHLSGDRNFTEAFRNGEDIHRRTAGEIFNFAPEMVTPEMRRSAKAINFGIVYSQTPHGLAQELNISRTEAEKYIRHYFEACPGIKEWTDKTVAEAKTTGYVQTFAGRRRVLPDLTSSNRNLRMAAERAAGNMPVQGGSAEIIKKAMLDIASAFKDVPYIHILLQIHDELIFEVRTEKLQEAAAIIKEKMEKAYSLSVPLVAELKAGPNWRDMKKMSS